MDVLLCAAEKGMQRRRGAQRCKDQFSNFREDNRGQREQGRPDTAGKIECHTGPPVRADADLQSHKINASRTGIQLLNILLWSF